jgi:hypothetical protein
MTVQSKAIIVGVTLIALSIGAVKLIPWLADAGSPIKNGTHGQSSVEKREEHNAETIKSLERRLARLEAEQTRSKFSGSLEKEKEQEVEEIADHEQTPQPPTEEEIEEDHLERLRSEPVDRDWENTLANKIDALIDIPELNGTEVSAVSCGSTTCLINASFGGVQQRETFMQKMMFEFGRYNGFSRNADDNGRFSSRLYLMKVPPIKYVDKNGNEYLPESF